jgi:hypothetical protein
MSVNAMGFLCVRCTYPYTTQDMDFRRDEFEMGRITATTILADSMIDLRDSLSWPLSARNAGQWPDEPSVDNSMRTLEPAPDGESFHTPRC